LSCEIRAGYFTDFFQDRRPIELGGNLQFARFNLSRGLEWTTPIVNERSYPVVVDLTQPIVDPGKQDEEHKTDGYAGEETR